MNEATREFIRIHADEDVRQLAFLGKKFPEVDMAYALDQIAGRQKARVKIPSWAATDGIVYPPHLSMEQCSSEQTARYKARIAGEGKMIVDLTAGFGVDMAFMSAGFKQAVHVEMQPQLSVCRVCAGPLFGKDEGVLWHSRMLIGGGAIEIQTTRVPTILHRLYQNTSDFRTFP